MVKLVEISCALLYILHHKYFSKHMQGCKYIYINACSKVIITFVRSSMYSYIVYMFVACIQLVTSQLIPIFSDHEIVYTYDIAMYLRPSILNVTEFW